MTSVMDFFGWMYGGVFMLISEVWGLFADLLLIGAAHWWVWLIVVVAAGTAWIERHRIAAWAAKRNARNATDDSLHTDE